MRTSVSQKWYVYTYAYPDGTVFYVGKGTRDRIKDHFREARQGVHSHKCNVIRKIWREGKRVLTTKVAFFNIEKEALLFEQQLIAFIGRANLTNETNGGEAGSGRSVQREKLAFVGKGIDSALLRIGMTRSDLAHHAGVDPSTVTKVCLGTRQTTRITFLKWCSILQCPDWMEEYILNAAGYASQRQMERVNNKQAIEQSHQQILEVLEQKGGE